MKVKFRLYSGYIKAFTLLFLLFLSACYSVEFKPVENYPVLRRSDPEEVEIRYTRPQGNYDNLGILVFRDFSGSTDDPGFLRIVRSEAKERGAQGAWILSRSYHETEMINTESTSSTRATTRSINTGQLTGSVGIVQVLLFNWKYNPSGP